MCRSGSTQEGREFKREVSETDGEDRRQRPDVIVHLPGDRQVVIDTKVRMALAKRLLIGIYIMLARGEACSLNRCLACWRSIETLHSNYRRIPTVTHFEKTPDCFGKLSRLNEGVTDSPSWATLGEPEKTNGQIRHPAQNQKTRTPRGDG